MFNKLYLVSVIILLQIALSTELIAQALEWKSFTSVGSIRDIEVGGGRVWSGSNGGVLNLNINDSVIQKFTNTEGLSVNEVVGVEIDQHGTVWFALFNGVLNRFFPDTQEFEVFEDYKDEVITDMVAFGDSLYIGLDFGVSLFIIDKKEVKETYVNLGLSSGENIEKIGANSVFIDGLEIWVATNEGIALSSLSLTNLQAPSSWNQFTTASGLRTNRVNEVVVLESTPFAATRQGISKLVDGTWQDAGLNGTDIRAIRLAPSNQLFPANTLVALTSTGVFWLDSNEQWQRLGSSFSDITAITTDENGNIWIGREDRGLANFNFENNDWQLFSTNSPGSNNFKSLALDSQGRLWCASQVAGVHVLEGEAWTNYTRANSDLSSNDQRTVIVDASDRVWFGSWGGGISIFEEDGLTISRFDTTGGILAGSVSPGFVLVNAMTRDQFDNIWILNRLANNTRVLVSYTADEQFVHFSTTEGIIPSVLVLSIEIDLAGRVWIGDETFGVKVLDPNGTVLDKSDDFSPGNLTVAGDGLAANKITALAVDRDGTMWIGTEEGINFDFRGSTGTKFGLINDFVNTIGVDARNNKWFGTANGVSVLSSDGVTWTHYTTGNSPLVSGNVQSFTFNEETGEVWIGTTNGLSRLQTPFTAPQQNLSLLTGFPNPFRLDDGNETFTITNLAENSNVNIYNVSGKTIRSYSVSDIPGGQVFWDGKDEDGNLVASGIYVYLAFTENQISATGKVAVVRR